MNRKAKNKLKYYRTRFKEKPAEWQPLQQCVAFTEEQIKQILEQERQVSDNSEDWTEEKIQKYVADMMSCTYYKNNLYQVAKYPPATYAAGWPEIIHLSIKRLDKTPVHSWSHLQLIKNEVVGNEYEAVEIYPAESRIVNMANQYHLWVINEEGVSLPIGFFDGRRVAGQVEGSQSKQNLVNTEVNA